MPDFVSNPFLIQDVPVRIILQINERKHDIKKELTKLADASRALEQLENEVINKHKRKFEESQDNNNISASKRSKNNNDQN